MLFFSPFFLTFGVCIMNLKLGKPVWIFYCHLVHQYNSELCLFWLKVKVFNFGFCDYVCQDIHTCLGFQSSHCNLEGNERVDMVGHGQCLWLGPENYGCVLVRIYRRYLCGLFSDVVIEQIWDCALIQLSCSCFSRINNMCMPFLWVKTCAFWGMLPYPTLYL